MLGFIISTLPKTHLVKSYNAGQIIKCGRGMADFGNMGEVSKVSASHRCFDNGALFGSSNGICIYW